MPGSSRQRRVLERARGPGRSAVIDVLDAGGMTQLGGSSSAFEPLLLTQRFLVFQEQSQPFGVFEAARFGLGIEVLEAFGHTVETEAMQQVEGRMVSMLDNPFNGSHRGRADWDVR